ncbi:MAG: TonB-dependent receptor, partial [Terriglobales bacterium]
MRARNNLLWMLVLLLGAAGEANATSAASIEGRVTDAAGGAIPNGQVELRAAQRVQTYRATTDGRGEFRFLAVEPGEYLLTVEAPGYFHFEQRLQLKPRQALALVAELTLRPTVEQQIEVTATTSQDADPQASTSRFLTREALDQLPAPLTRNVPTLVENLAPGAVLSHDNFVHVRGNELSLHEFVNGVSFLDNAHQHFTPGFSPQIMETVNVITGGFPAEFGNRFGGILDITTRSGQSLGGHGSASLRGGTVANHDGSVEYGGARGRWGYYGFAGGFSSDRFLNPAQPEELHDFGYGVRGAAQADYHSERDMFRLLVTAGRTEFELPNTETQEAAGRDASRLLRSQTAILNWQRVLSSRTLFSASAYERILSERLLPTADPETTLADGSRSTLSAGFKADVNYARGGHVFKAGVDLLRLRLLESLAFDPREDGPEADSSGELEAFFFHQGAHGGQVSLYAQDHFSPLPNLTLDVGVRWDQ